METKNVAKTVNESAKELLTSSKELSLNAIFASMREVNVKSNLGLGRDNLYKKNLFKDMTTDEIKRQRRKIRNFTENILISILRSKNETERSKLIKSFKDWYTSIYQCNDYTVESLASKNTDANKIENYRKALAIINANK